MFFKQCTLIPFSCLKILPTFFSPTAQTHKLSALSHWERSRYLKEKRKKSNEMK